MTLAPRTPPILSDPQLNVLLEMFTHGRDTARNRVDQARPHPANADRTSIGTLALSIAVQADAISKHVTGQRMELPPAHFWQLVTDVSALAFALLDRDVVLERPQ